MVRTLGLKLRYDQRGLILAGFQEEKHKYLMSSRGNVKCVVMILTINGICASEPVKQRIQIIALAMEGFLPTVVVVGRDGSRTFTPRPTGVITRSNASTLRSQIREQQENILTTKKTSKHLAQ